MARVNTVAKRRVGKRGAHELRCLTCGQPIEYGQPYKWFKQKQARGGVKKSYHPDCAIPPSHRTTSRMGTIYDAQAALDFSGCESVDDLQAALQDFAQVVRDVGEEYRESVSNMEEGFGHRTSQADELEERAEALEGWADDLDSWEPDTELPELPEEEADDEAREEYESALDTIRDEARDATDEVPV